jgi:sterol desaturase/sphingolipid hydroxylase (fatty acid hydroxylase superfamily)
VGSFVLNECNQTTKKKTARMPEEPTHAAQRTQPARTVRNPRCLLHLSLVFLFVAVPMFSPFLFALSPIMGGAVECMQSTGKK